VDWLEPFPQRGGNGSETGLASNLDIVRQREQTRLQPVSETACNTRVRRRPAITKS
jgi:hypothetical protein